jgi:hypothetical protein
MELKELELTDVAGHIKPTAIELTLIVILWLYSLRKNGSNPSIKRDALKRAPYVKR